jgi:hypothetical protein
MTAEAYGQPLRARPLDADAVEEYLNASSSTTWSLATS